MKSEIKRRLENAIDIFTNVGTEEHVQQQIEYMFIETLVTTDRDSKERANLKQVKEALSDLVRSIYQETAQK